MKNIYPSRARNLLALACVAALSAVPVMAQDTAPKPEDSLALETITVTGSRISNPNVNSPTPISVLTAAQIKATGAVNIGDLMTQMPQLATTFTMGNSSRYIGTTGVQEQDLRNLGTNRTLVLVNGRRYVGSTAGDTGVDVNMIPVDFIERVEIITGGASAVYGADAVTGVVNFILKKNYQGADLHAQYGSSQHGGFDREFVSITGGMNFAQNRGNVAVSIEHSNQGSLEFKQRFGHQSYAYIKTPNGPAEATLFADAGDHNIDEGGLASIGNNTYVFNADGSARPQNLGTNYDGTYCQACDRLDYNQVSQLQPRYARTTLSTIASFDISPDHRLYAEGTYSHVDSTSKTEPDFGYYAINRENPYITPSLAALMDANGGQTIGVSRYDVDAGRRGEDTGRNLARLVLGANGTLAGDWQYDTSVNYGVTRERRLEINDRITDRFAASVDAVRDPATGNVVCRSTLDPNSFNETVGGVLNPIALQGGCVPTSVFGEGAVNREAAAWFNHVGVVTSKLTQFVGGATVTNNNLFAMPGDAGSASIAAGVEFRRETSKQITDPLDAAGLTSANAIPSSGGAYDVKEAFIETAVPLLTGHTMVQNLTFDAAARFSDYSTMGHTKAWRWGLDWAIDDNIRLRGTMSSAVRAPNIGELFSGQAQNYGFIGDPCSASQRDHTANPAVRAANCLAQGVPVDFESTNGANVPGISGSNPNLASEEGRTWTAGLVFTPQFLPGFGLTADYWNIKLNNAVSQLSFDAVVERCIDAPSGINNVYCQNTTRDPNTHEVNFVRAINQNIAAVSTSGIDIGTYYTHDLGAGQMRWNVDATKVISYVEHPFQDDPTTSYEDKGTLGIPEWKVSLRATYTLKDWTFNWDARYFSRQLLVGNESYKHDPNQISPSHAPAGFFNDVKVAYDFSKTGWQAYAGITNVFDRNAPTGFFGTSGSGAMYDTLGRSYYVGVNYNFK